MTVKIVFCNQHFVVVNKAPETLSVYSRLGKEDPRSCLGHDLAEELKTKIFPVHRLDYEVGGLILYALHSKAQEIASQWFEKKEIQKTYEAYTHTALLKSELDRLYPLHEKQVWECLLMKGKKRAYEKNIGKKSQTWATRIESISPYSDRWLLNPITGRSHQLRYELYRHQCPIDGDTLYGSTISFSPGIKLTAIKIDFSDCHERETFMLPETILLAE